MQIFVLHGEGNSVWHFWKTCNRMKITENDWRSLLSSSSLSDLMLIHSETESIEKFGPLDSILLWNSSGSRARRPFCNDKKVKPVKFTNRSLSIDTDDVFLIAEELDVAREGVCDDDGDNDDNAADDEDYLHRQDLIVVKTELIDL
ncbi:uncharacterized protein LOC123542892 isoform X2 [Mercenaria mercenaria]|nr:uncharacterized protein LOC123542892 isoform X2 [Mercenaria mercenaria]